MVHGLVYWGHRVIVPAAAREQMLELLHETHQGACAMKAVARTRVWWPRFDADIEQMASNCPSCVQSRPMPPAKPPVNWPMTQEIWFRLHVDFAGPLNGTMILVVGDSHTKWIEAVTMPHATAEATITALREIFSRLGIPRTVVSDNGTQFPTHLPSFWLETTSNTYVRHLTTRNQMV